MIRICAGDRSGIGGVVEQDVGLLRDRVGGLGDRPGVTRPDGDLSSTIGQAWIDVAAITPAP
ncbi:hypothetical protein [Rhodococcus sp. ACT016]|uniref:hypothetical protein n=1 Tax=Rhodococcus sp. ACT016 TaxID=3134808 RepID=UPI003D2827E9